MERVMVFIDGANFFFGMIDRRISPKINYSKFVAKLVHEDRKLIRTYYFDAHIDQYKDRERYKKQQKFFYHLGSLPYFEIRKGRMFQGRQKGVDVKIGLDMFTHAVNDRYDTAILVSADSDLVYPVQEVKSRGKHVELAFFDLCYELKQECDIFVEITDSYLADCR